MRLICDHSDHGVIDRAFQVTASNGCDVAPTFTPLFVHVSTCGTECEATVLGSAECLQDHLAGGADSCIATVTASSVDDLVTALRSDLRLSYSHSAAYIARRCREALALPLAS